MLKLKFRDQTGDFFKLSVTAVSLGRDAGNDVVVDDPSVSDFHAEITTDAQQPWIVDLLSANGTWVNDQRITQPCRLEAWDIIRLGNVELEVTDPSSHRPQDWALRAESDLLASQFHTLGKHTVVGRDPACDISIDGSMLSRRHAELIIEEGCLQVIDLNSANGTFINGRRVEQGRAYPGDEIRFDQQVFVVAGPQRQEQSAGGASEQTQIRDEAAETIVGVVTDSGSTPEPLVEQTAEPIPDPVSESAPKPDPAAGEVEPVSPLKPEQELDAGHTKIAPPAQEEEETQLYVPPPPPSFLTELDPPGIPRNMRLDSPELLLGRSPDCDWVLDETSVSKQHAKLQYSAGTWTLRDLGSSNGTLLNGRPVDQARLNSGDRLQFGRLVFEFTMESEQAQDDDSATRLFDAAAAERVRDKRIGPRKRVLLAASVLLIGLGVAAFLAFS